MATLINFGYHTPMDIELLHTFLEVNRTRHFARAAENLFVTQAAVSARVRQLEQIVGGSLFTRDRNNIQLTPTGHRLLGHAESILNTWNLALLDTQAEAEDQSLVAFGCLPSLWEIYVSDWIFRLRADAPAALLQVELLQSQALVNRVREQSLNLALLYQPVEVADLHFEQITTVELALVTTEPSLADASELDGYVHVDWGTSFAIATTRIATPTYPPVLRVDTPKIAKEYILSNGGAAYLPQSMICAEIDAGQLHPVADTPTFHRPVFVASNAKTAESAAIAQVVTSLRNSM